jgi:uncharacterized protein
LQLATEAKDEETSMKCPHCQTEVTDRIPSCPKCSFTLADLDAKLGPPPPRPQALLDTAELLSADERRSIEERCALFAQRTGAEMLVVTLRSAQPVLAPEYAFWLFNHWQVGGETHAGLLVLLCVDDHRLDCEVGYELEGIVTDEASTELLREHAAPWLKRGQIGEGLARAADVLAQLVESGLQPVPRWRRWFTRSA